MRWFCKFPLRFRSLFKRRRVEEELSDELRFHLEKLIEEKIAKGMTPEQARYAALCELGGVEQIKEECRDMRRVNHIEDFLQDLRYGQRMLRKNPGFTVAAVVALALGIGPNAAIFSVVRAVLLQPSPFNRPEGLTVIWQKDKKANSPEPEHVSVPDFLDWKQQATAFEEMGATGDDSNIYTLAVSGPGEPPRLRSGLATANLFRVLGVQPALGRAFSPDEEKVGTAKAVMISCGLWQGQWAGSTEALGKQLVLNGDTYRVVGVMPPGFQLPPMGHVDLVFPVPIDSPVFQNREVHILHAIARLKAGMTLEQARAQMETVSGRLAQQYPEADGPWTANVLPLSNTNPDLKHTLLALTGAVALLLLVACGNVANLLLARGLGRQKEFAVRSALGANRLRVIRQLFVESMLLAVMGCALGLLFAWWSVGLLSAWGAQNIPDLENVRLDGAVIAFTLALSMLTALVFGLAPALLSSRFDLNRTLKEASGALTEGVRHQRLRSLLVVSEIALALVVLAGGGLLARSFMRLASADPGFDMDNLVTQEITLPKPRYVAPIQFQEFYSDLLNRVKASVGVQSISAVSTLHIGYAVAVGSFFHVPEQAVPLKGKPMAMTRRVEPGYFRTLGVPLLQGRDFDARDTATSSPVVIINRTLAHRFFGEKNPVGASLSIVKSPQPQGDPQQLAPGSVEIVGVVGNVKHWFVGGDPHDDNEIYVPFSQRPVPTMTLVARLSGRSRQGLASAIHSGVVALDKGLPLYASETMRQRLSETIAPRRFYPLLLGMFAGIALVLSSFGIYSVMSCVVAERTHEIGVRMAMGAHQNDVLRLVVRQGLALTLAGVAVGLLGALALTRFLSNMLYNISPTDSLTLGSVSFLLAGVATLACYMPARRATKVDPTVALRYE